MVPSKASADMPTVSERVGWGWTVSPVSVASAPISTAREVSAISSPALGPTGAAPSRGVGVDGEADVGGVGAHLDGQGGIGDQLAGVGADGGGADEAVGGLVEQQLGHALVAPEGQGTAAGRPGEGALAVLDAGRLGLGLGDADPGDLGVGVGHRGD